jgi:NADPH:quinone reductase-like Zn-dependent oxidoreductase
MGQHLSMKAVVIRRFGPPDVMKVEEVETPNVAGDHVLIRVHCSSVNPVDWKIRNGSLRLISGSRFPMALGFDVAGEVMDAGPSATRFKRGDRVFGMLDFRHRGAYAEYACAREDSLVPIPETLGFKEAAVIPLAALTAFQALHDKGKMRKDEMVLVNGASGGVGTFAVQIARAAGARVTAVCGPGNTELVRGLGAHRVIDYQHQDFTQLPERYDIIFDAVGKLSFFLIRNNLNRSGRYITTLPNKPSDMLSFFLTPVLSLFGSQKKSTMVNVRPKGTDLEQLCLLIKQNLLSPVIDRVFRLGEISEAHAYSETGHARGKIAIQVS